MRSKHLKKSDEYKDLPAAEVIRASLADVISGKVTKEQVMEVVKAEAIRAVEMEKNKKKKK